MGHSEIHPIYDIKILDKGSESIPNDSNPSPVNNNLIPSYSNLASKDNSSSEPENSD